MWVTSSRRKIAAALLFVSVLLLALLFAAGRGRGRFSSFLVAEEVYSQLAEERREDAGLIPPSLAFSDSPLFFDEASRTCYYSLPEGDGSAFDPAVFFPASGGIRLAVAGGEITPDAIAGDHTWKLLFYNDRSCAQCSLKCTTLPLLSLSCESEIGDVEEEMALFLYDNREGVTQRRVKSDGTVRLRGRTTRYLPKPGLRLKLTERSPGESLRSRNVSLLGMRKDNDWILYAAYNDQERVRRVFSCNLWYGSCAANNDLSLPLGMEFRYVELFVNGEYYGLYALGYPVDNGGAHTAPEKGEVLYKKYEWYEEEDAVFAPGAAVKGYHISGYGDEEESGDGAAPLNDGGEGSGGRDDYLYLRDYLKGLYLHADDPSALEAMADMDNAVDNYLFYNLIQGVDNVSINNIKNIFLASKVKDGARKMYYIPWDIDISWGNGFGVPQEGRESPYVYAIPPSRNAVMCHSVPEALINADPGRMIPLVTDRYFALRRGGWSDEAVDALLGQLEEDIFSSGAYRREISRWPGSDQIDPDAGLSRFRAYVRQRLACADDYYARLAAEGAGNFYVRQSLAAEEADSRDLLVGINDPAVLEDPELAEFLAMQGVDTGALAEEAGFLLIRRAEKDCLFYPAFSSYDGEIDTPSGTLRLLDEFGEPVDEDYTASDENAVLLYLDEKEVWEVNAPANRFADPAVQMALLREDGSAETLNTARRFVPLRGILQCRDPEVLAALIRENRLDVVVEIGDASLWDSAAFRRFLADAGADPAGARAGSADPGAGSAGTGANPAEAGPSCDMVVIPADKAGVSFHEGLLGAQAPCDTALGVLFSYRDESRSVLYLNGEELYSDGLPEGASCRLVFADPARRDRLVGILDLRF